MIDMEKRGLIVVERTALQQDIHRLISMGDPLKINPDTYIDDYRKSMTGVGEEALRICVDLETMKLPWLKRFNGLIPARLANSHDLKFAFEVAGRYGIALDKVTVDAGISYPDRYLAETVAKTQDLDWAQLTLFWLTKLAGPYNGFDIKQKISSRFDEGEVEKARIIAQKLEKGELHEIGHKYLKERFVAEYLP